MIKPRDLFSWAISVGASLLSLFIVFHVMWEIAWLRFPIMNALGVDYTTFQPKALTAAILTLIAACIASFLVFLLRSNRGSLEFELLGLKFKVAVTVVIASFKKNSTMLDVVRKCGIPDKHAGSGIYIFVYYMNDCSTVTVGTPDLKRLGIRHVKQNKTTVLFNNW